MYRLLIVDDEDDERIGIKYLMKKYGYACSRFQDIENIIDQVMKRLEKKLALDDSPSRVIIMVEQYIQMHYKEELSLDILADKV